MYFRHRKSIKNYFILFIDIIVSVSVANIHPMTTPICFKYDLFYHLDTQKLLSVTIVCIKAGKPFFGIQIHH